MKLKIAAVCMFSYDACNFFVKWWQFPCKKGGASSSSGFPPCCNNLILGVAHVILSLFHLQSCYGPFGFHVIRSETFFFSSVMATFVRQLKRILLFFSTSFFFRFLLILTLIKCFYIILWYTQCILFLLTILLMFKCQKIYYR